MDSKLLCFPVINVGLPVSLYIDDGLEILCPIQPLGIHRGLTHDDRCLLQVLLDHRIRHPGAIVFNDTDLTQQRALGLRCEDHFLGPWKRVDQNER